MVAQQTADIYVLDTWPLMEWIQQREPATSRLDLLIEQTIRGQIRLVMCRINFGEVLYSCWKLNRTDSAQLLADVEALPIEVMLVDDLLVTEAARLKAHTTASYADCFAAALALRHHVPVITGDHDFQDLLLMQPDLQVHWLGS